jgi:hypothetical protein
MANVTTVRILNDGPRNVILLCVGVLDTSDQAATDVLTLADCANPTPLDYRIDEVEFSVSGVMNVQLLWKANTDVVCLTMAQSGEFDFRENPYLTNNAGAGKNGTLRIKTAGWASVQTYSVLIHLVKMGV